jgi:hypothetical protein
MTYSIMIMVMVIVMLVLLLNEKKYYQYKLMHILELLLKSVWSMDINIILTYVHNKQYYIYIGIYITKRLPIFSVLYIYQ